MFTVLGGALTLFDGPAGYRPAEDSLWLAALAPRSDGPLCDVGCGTGAVGLAYLSCHKNTPPLSGFDVQSDMIAAANKAATYNMLGGHFDVGDIASPPYESETFSLTLANPPFYDPNREMPTHKKEKHLVKFTDYPLTRWLEGMADLTKPGGSIALIVHKKDEASLIQHAEKLGCFLIKTVTLQGAPHKPGKRIILQFIKNQKPGQKATASTILTFDKATRIKFLKETP